MKIVIVSSETIVESPSEADNEAHAPFKPKIPGKISKQGIIKIN
jgi:hypothetical protein